MQKGATNATATKKYTGIEVQTSALGVPIAITWGSTRISANLIWYGDFKADPVKQSKGGKGGGKGPKMYNYSAAVMMALCEGPITSIGKVWADQDTTTLAKLGLTLFTGTSSQAAWSYLVSKHPDQALSYARTAYLATSSYKMGMTPTLPNHNFEVIKPPAAGSTYDANPADIEDDLLNNPQYGLGPCAIDATSQAQYRTYCQAQGIFLSPALTSAEQISSVLDRWANITNTWRFWDGAALRYVPLGDVAITANGVTYTPDLTIQYALTPDDFIVSSPASPPVTISRADQADLPNHVKLEVLDRTKNYNNAIAEWLDQGLADQFGRIDANVSSAHEICDLTVANVVAQLVGQRAAYNANSYAFTLGRPFTLLLPGDLVTVLVPSVSITTPRTLRIVSMDEDEEGNWSVAAEEFVQGLGTANIDTTPSSAGTGIDQSVDPGDVNPPAVWEPPPSVAGQDAQIWIAASGGADWGGCVVMLSFDGLEYIQAGVIGSPAWQGTLSSTLADHADPDTSDTLAVDLAISDGVMATGATHADADAFRTLCLVTPSYATAIPGGEVIAYGAVAQGVTANAFNLTYLRRGLYGTTHASHASGSFFTRFDLSDAKMSIGGSVLAYDLHDQYVGQTIHLKLLSFNRFGKALQDITDVTEYTYEITGAGQPDKIDSAGTYIVATADVTATFALISANIKTTAIALVTIRRGTAVVTADAVITITPGLPGSMEVQSGASLYTLTAGDAISWVITNRGGGVPANVMRDETGAPVRDETGDWVVAS